MLREMLAFAMLDQLLSPKALEAPAFAESVLPKPC
jgi:hypothetical protein